MKPRQASLRVIFFDAGSVLFTTPTSHEQRLRSVLQSRGFLAEQQSAALATARDVLQRMKDEQRWPRTWEEERGLWQAYYRTLVHQLVGDDQTLVDELFHLCHFVNHCVLYDDVLPTLERLRPYVQFGVISNAHPSLDWVFDRLDVRHHFASITLSGPVGYGKPDRTIFEIALASLQCSPSEAFFVDNKPRNVEAARALGIQGITLLRSDGADTPHITTLSALEHMLFV